MITESAALCAGLAEREQYPFDCLSNATRFCRHEVGTRGVDVQEALHA